MLSSSSVVQRNQKILLDKMILSQENGILAQSYITLAVECSPNQLQLSENGAKANSPTFKVDELGPTRYCLRLTKHSCKKKV